MEKYVNYEVTLRGDGMTTVGTVQADIDLRYRNTFTPAQKYVWMNDEIQDLYEIFELSMDPYNFPTIADVPFYPIPTGLDIDRIKVMTIQTNTLTNPTFAEVPFRRNAPMINEEYSYWYTIVGDSFFIDVPGGTVDDMTVYIYTDQPPEEITTAEQQLQYPRKYNEIFKLGVLKRIAQARKDIQMYNNYDLEREQLVQELLWKMKMDEPEWVTPADVMPKTESNSPYSLNYGYPFWRLNGQ